MNSEPISISSAEHYTWGDNCDGWYLLRDAALHVIQERMPAGTSERKHYHSRAQQLFYVLSGELTMRFDDATAIVHPRECIRIAPGTAHQAANEGSDNVDFLVISSPPSHGDRTNVE